MSDEEADDEGVGEAVGRPMDDALPIARHAGELKRETLQADSAFAEQRPDPIPDLTDEDRIRQWYDENFAIPPDFKEPPNEPKIVTKLKDSVVQELIVFMSEELRAMIEDIVHAQPTSTYRDLFGWKGEMSAIDEEAVTPFDPVRAEEYVEDELFARIYPTAKRVKYPPDYVVRIFLERVETVMNLALGAAAGYNKNVRSDLQRMAEAALAPRGFPQREEARLQAFVNQNEYRSELSKRTRALNKLRKKLPEGMPISLLQIYMAVDDRDRLLFPEDRKDEFVRNLSEIRMSAIDAAINPDKPSAKLLTDFRKREGEGDDEEDDMKDNADALEAILSRLAVPGQQEIVETIGRLEEEVAALKKAYKGGEEEKKGEGEQKGDDAPPAPPEGGPPAPPESPGLDRKHGRRPHTRSVSSLTGFPSPPALPDERQSPERPSERPERPQPPTPEEQPRPPLRPYKSRIRVKRSPAEYFRLLREEEEEERARQAAEFERDAGTRVGTSRGTDLPSSREAQEFEAEHVGPEHVGPEHVAGTAASEPEPEPEPNQKTVAELQAYVLGLIPAQYKNEEGTIGRWNPPRSTTPSHYILLMELYRVLNDLRDALRKTGRTLQGDSLESLKELQQELRRRDLLTIGQPANLSLNAAANNVWRLLKKLNEHMPGYFSAYLRAVSK